MRKNIPAIVERMLAIFGAGVIAFVIWDYFVPDERDRIAHHRDQQEATWGLPVQPLRQRHRGTFTGTR
ncbi:MAG: hypothetical protein R3313_02490 [Candidatus Saccharimonadales bacterium]|nr:hypothetical protein [Candidatus Saccharimonadales bacterium]